MPKKTLRLRGLRQRWLVSSLAPLALLLLLGCLVAYYSIANYYYSSMRQGLTARAHTSAEYFGSLTLSSYNEYYQQAYRYTETFDDKDRLELQFIGSGGQVMASSYGLTAGTTPGTSDVATALSARRTDVFEGRDPQTGESIMAVSTPLIYGGTVIGAMRFVTSLQRVDQQILHNMLLVLAVVLGCLTLVFITNQVFIRNVVVPVAEITEAAQRIAAGSYGIQIDNDYEDEIGELVDSVNQMSVKISQNEKMQQEFISSVSHELRTPLTAINGWGETLLADPSADPMQVRRGIGIILKETRRLSSMVEELLDFTKIQDGRFSLQIEPMDIQAEFEDAIFTYRELFRQEGIEVNYHAPEEMIDPISGDSERLKQVFCNVLDNAAKHGGSGKCIDASISQQEQQVVLKIRDYGPGIPEEELPFVKQKFYKGSSKARGSGIGLAVCDEIVQRHSGTFDIANAPGGGTVVTICLPLEK